MSDIAACGHTKIKEIKWNQDHSTSSKFMCLDCNTDFVPLTPRLREAVIRVENEISDALREGFSEGVQKESGRSGLFPQCPSCGYAQIKFMDDHSPTCPRRGIPTSRSF